MRQRDEQDEPHVGDGGFRVEKCLQRQSENDRRPPANFSSTNSHLRRRRSPGRPKARTPSQDRQCDERRCNCGWKTRREIVLAKNLVAGGLRPIGEGGLVEANLIVEVRDNVISAFDHLARSFSKAWLIAVD